MTSVNISPNMNLPVPVVGVEIGPAWATDLNACMSAIDSHDHATGQGVQITPNGINVNTDLPMGGNNLTAVRTVRFSTQAAALSAAADVGCIYEVGVDLYYNDGAGNQVRITQGGAVTGASGTITGLPSGTASASFAAGTFTFQSATNTPANMSFGPVTIGTNAASPKTVTIAPNGSQASNYNLTLPLALPAASGYSVQCDNTGALSFVLGTIGQLPIGAVIATFPNLTGAYSTGSTTSADARGFVLCQGQTISDGTSPMNGQVVPNINNSVFLRGNTTAGTAAGAATVTLSSANLAGHTHTFTSSTSVGTSSHTHGMAHYHQFAYLNGTPGGTSGSTLYAIPASLRSSANNTFTTGSPADVMLNNTFVTTSSTTASVMTGSVANTNIQFFTAGALDPPSGSGASAATGTPSASTTVSGTTDSTGSGTAFSILPPYITAVYLMRIK